MTPAGEFLAASLQDLIRINSVNPALCPDGPGEAAAAAWLVGCFQDLNIEVIPLEHAPGRVSVLARVRGAGGGRSLMLNAHIDTVGVEGMAEPFAASTDERGRMYGRGSYDMKGSVAAIVTAMRELSAGPPLAGDVLAALVADEEYASLGTREILKAYRTHGAIVTEPTALQVCLAHKGFAWIAVETAGVAAHGSRYDLGVDANLRMGAVLGQLAALEAELRARRPHPLLGPPSLHAATLHGGSGLSTYAAHCRLEIERRLVPGETRAQVDEELRSALERAGVPAGFHTFLWRDPFEIDPAAEIVKAVDAAATAVLGSRPRYVGETPWMDAALLSAAGIETVVIGPAGAGAHAAVEWVDVGSCIQLARILTTAARAYCSG